MNKKIIFVHGYTASSKADWYPNISPKLDKLGIDYVIPDFPGGEQPHSADWVETIRKEVEKSTKPVVLVGHSLGCRAILLYLNKYRKTVDSVILIAPHSNEVSNAKRCGGKAFPDFFEYKIDTAKIIKLTKKYSAILSKDDPGLEYKKHGLTLSKELGAKLITFENRKHFSAPENAPYILKVLREEVGF